MNFILQISACHSNGRIFATVTQIEVIPALNFSIRRALFDGTIFSMFAHSENVHFALARKQPPPRENCFQQFFPQSFLTSSRSICRPPCKPTSYHEPRTCMLTLLATCVCVVAVVSYRFRLQSFRYAYHACFCIHDVFCCAN